VSAAHEGRRIGLDEVRAMREEFRARFVMGSYLLCHITNLIPEITICKLGSPTVE